MEAVCESGSANDPRPMNRIRTDKRRTRWRAAPSPNSWIKAGNRLWLMVSPRSSECSSRCHDREEAGDGQPRVALRQGFAAGAQERLADLRLLQRRAIRRDGGETLTFLLLAPLEGALPGFARLGEH